MRLQPAFGEAFGQEGLERFFGGNGGARAGFADGLRGSAIRGEINLQGFAFMPVAGSLQDSGTAEAAMGEEHFFAEALAAGGGDDFGRDSGEVGVAFAIGGVEDQRHQSGARRNDSEAELLGEIVAVTGSAHFGDGEAAGGDDERWGAVFGGCAADDE